MNETDFRNVRNSLTNQANEARDACQAAVAVTNALLLIGDLLWEHIKTQRELGAHLQMLNSLIGRASEETVVPTRYRGSF